MSTRHLVLTVIGDDRPGIVEQLATAISSHHGNWLESSMAHLAGKFAGIVEVSVDSDHLDPLNAALEDLPGLRVTAEETGGDLPSATGQHLTLSLVGHDRIGIVREVSQVLAQHGVNVEALNTFTASAPMSAEILFHADADLLAAATADIDALRRSLEALSDDLMVDIRQASRED